MLQIGRAKNQSFVAAAEDGALTFGVDEDKGLGAGPSGRTVADCSTNSGVGEGFAVEGGGEVVAELADVAGAEAPVLAGDDGGGDLSAGKNGGGGVLDLGAALGEPGERDDGIGGVEADADEVNLGDGVHLFDVNGFGGLRPWS